MKFRKKYIPSIIIVVLSIVIMVLAYHQFGQHKLLPANRDDMPPPPQPTSLQPTQKIQGVVLRYGANPRGDIDKILIGIDEDSTWFHFPPHTAKQVLNIATLQSTVTIKYGERLEKKEAESRGEIKSISNNKNETIDVKTILPPPPTMGNEVTVQGDKIEIKKDEHGKGIAFVLSNKLIVLPPHAIEDLFPLITSAKTIEVKGRERGNSDGFVNINGLHLVQPDEITIDNTKYLVR